MIYDLSTPLGIENFKARSDYLIRKGGVVELTEKSKNRTIRQNKYLHLILAYFATQTGNTTEWVKQKYFKIHVNPQIFIRTRNDNFVGNIKYLRSTSELDTAEMTTAIERFRNWSSSEAGIYLPSPEDNNMIIAMEIEVERAKNYT